MDELMPLRRKRSAMATVRSRGEDVTCALVSAADRTMQSVVAKSAANTMVQPLADE